MFERGRQRACGARRESSGGRMSNQKKSTPLASVSQKGRFKQVPT